MPDCNWTNWPINWDDLLLLSIYSWKKLSDISEQAPVLFRTISSLPWITKKTTFTTIIFINLLDLDKSMNFSQWIFLPKTIFLHPEIQEKLAKKKFYSFHQNGTKTVQVEICHFQLQWISTYMVDKWKLIM